MRLLLILILFAALCAAKLKMKEAGEKFYVGQTKPTNQWVIKLKKGISPVTFAKDHDLEYIRKVNSGHRLHLFESKSGRGKPSIDSTLYRMINEKLSYSPDVEFHDQQYLKMQMKRGHPRNHVESYYSIKKNSLKKKSAHRHKKRGRPLAKRDSPPNDPEYNHQWHLSGSFGPLVHVNTEPVWAQGYSGKGVTVAVVDDGCNHASPDLEGNYRQDLSWNYNDNNEEPSPYTSDDHGTAASGVCCAVKNNVCGVGAAYDADLVCIRLIAGPSTDLMEAEALTHSKDIRIYSNSWGPADYGNDLVAPGLLTRMALKRATTGEGFKSIIFWAGGNGREYSDNGNYDGYANDIHTIAVGAHDQHGKFSFYSEECACLFLSAPSSGNDLGITTTDLQGMFGSTDGDCRPDFGGTSSATPLAAGIAALILEKHPDMDYRGIMHTFAKGCRKIDDTYWDWTNNTRGYHHSHTYGFGHPDAKTLLDVSEEFAENLPQQIHEQTAVWRGDRAIPQESVVAVPRLLGGRDHTLRINFDIDDSEINFVEQVQLEIDFRHYHRGNVRISLLSPAGVVSRLAEFRRDRNRDTPMGGWKFSSVVHWGEEIKGQWTLLLDDVGHTSLGHLTKARLHFYGMHV